MESSLILLQLALEILMKNRSISSRRSFIATGLAAIPFFNIKALADACRVTEDNPRGPYHRRGAPWRIKLCGINEPGEPLMISGRVTAAETCQPLKGVTLDVWQANAAGRYDNDDRKHPPDPNKFLLRGQMNTDEDGLY